MKKKGGRKERLFIEIIILRENLQQVNFVIYIYIHVKRNQNDNERNEKSQTIIDLQW